MTVKMILVWIFCVSVLGAFQCEAAMTGCASDFGGTAGEFCYFFSHAEATWSDAKTVCESKGGSLAAVDDPNVQIYLGGYVEYTTKQTLVTLPTANDYHYHYLHDLGLDVTQHTAVTFKVQACHDAHIALSSVKNLDTSDTYEVVIGGWSDSKSVIRDCKQCTNMDEAIHSSAHPLSCTDFRPFWISWDNHVIRVGTGNDVGQAQFMSWNDTTPHAVNYVAIATGFGSSGNWTFDIQTYSPGKFWIGGQYVANENGWLWLPSQTPVSEFQNWAPNEPDSANGNQHCLIMDMHSNMQWRDEDCAEKRNFICQTPYLEPGIVG